MAKKAIPKYEEEDRSFIVHRDDVDLKPIEISLPKAPPVELIAGYGLEPLDQFFRQEELPPRLRAMEKQAMDSLQKRAKVNKNFVVTGYRLVEKFWELFERERDTIEDEVAFIKRVHWHCLHGYWVFIKGKPTYLPGDYYDFLNFWTQPDVKRFEYRDADRKRYLLRLYGETCTETFAVLDSDTNDARKSFDKYVMKEIGSLVCFGTAEPKFRRGGMTSQGCHKVVKRTREGFGRYGTLVSMEGDNAEKHWKKKLIPGWRGYPLWLRPMWDGPAAPKTIKYDHPSGDLSGWTPLNGYIDYTDSAGEKKNDGDKIHVALFDEEGKCLNPDVEILMSDGSRKKAKNVVVGDKLMGDNFDHRTVRSITSGEDEMYKIIPKKGEQWECNKPHVLTVKISDICYINGVKQKLHDVIDISVRDYLNIHDCYKNALCLIKKGVDYTKQDHIVEPYMMGLWLGDGSINSGGITVANTERDIIDYLKEYASDRDMVYSDYRTDGRNCFNAFLNRKRYYTYIEDDGSVSCWQKKKELSAYLGISDARNIPKERVKKYETKPFKYLLEAEGVLHDKTVPYSFIYDSMDNRLLFLAGMIDSDGYAAKSPKQSYDVTQKKECLADGVAEIAMSCGFSVRRQTKIATMNREDGGVYKCKVYRVYIYGRDLWRIPCKVSRKKYHKKEHHKNSRNPMVTGFKVEPVGRGPYNGFTLDGNGRFLLGDYTVTHNTESGSIFERWNVNKLAMSLGGGSEIIGWSMHPSTVEEMDEGGIEYMMLCGQSKFYNRQPNGQTLSGLFELFIPAQDGLEGFVDKWGFSVTDDPTEEQIRSRPTAIFAQMRIGARKYLQDKLDVLLKRGDPASLEQYRSERRKMPMCYADCWLGTSGDMGFNIEIIDARRAELRRRKKHVNGFFKWRGGVQDTEVEWVNDPNGRFEISRIMQEQESNRKIKQEAYDFVKDEDVYEWAPVNGNAFTLGMDPFRYNNKQDAKMSNSGSRQSDGGIAVLWERDEKLDPGPNPHEWESRRFVCSYRYRPRSQAEYFEDCLMAAVYFGSMVYMERNIERGWEYFIDRGYGGYLMYEIDRVTGKKKEKPGFTSLTQSKASLFSEIKDYIEQRGHKECHSSFLKECKDIKGQEEMTKYDQLTAHGACLLGSQQNYHNRLLDGERSQGGAVDLRAITSILQGF